MRGDEAEDGEKREHGWEMHLATKTVKLVFLILIEELDLKQ